MHISKIKPNQLYRGALYRKMMRYWIKLSIKHPSETSNYFENSYIKLIIFRYFYNIPMKIKIFCNQNNFGLKFFGDIRFSMFLVQLDRQK